MTEPSDPLPTRRRRWPYVLGLLALGAAVIIGAAVVAGRTRPADDDDAMSLRDAQAILADGHNEEAIQAFQEILTLDLANVEALRDTGAAYEAQEDWPQAARWYEKWTQVAPGDAKAFVILGNTRYQLDEYESTVAALERAAAPGEESAHLHRWLFS